MNKLVTWIVMIAGIASSTVAHADKVFRAGKGATWDCKDDPVVHIENGKGTYALKGNCKSVNLVGGGNTLTAETSDDLNIIGSRNKVTIDTVGAITVTGSDNTVTYKAGMRGDGPAVNTIGKNNVVTGAKAAGGGAGGGGGGKPAPRETPSDTAGAQDCARNPTAEIENGEGSYKFVGPCTKIVVDGGENTLVIESVKEILINGGSNTVHIGSADKISVMGSDNKVTYKKGISGAKPKIGSLGENNTVTQVK